MSSEHYVIIGTRHAWGGEQPFGLSRVDRRHHCYVIGQTGSGKTTLLKNLILQDIEAGEGVGVIDPHGDLAEELLDHVPRTRTDHVVYFNPADLDYPIGFNLLRTAPTESRHLAASGIVGAFKSIWRDSWGPRLEYILYASLAALLDCENATLLGVQRMLSDRNYRDWVVRQVKDPVVRSFWEREFAGYDKRLASEAVAPIQNKIGQLLMSPPIRNILGQVRSKVDPAFMMDTGRIFIANLSKGRLGEDKSNLLGAVLVSQFQLAAMARAGVPSEERRAFHLFVDEFQNFASDSFASILSESRKYALSMVLSHQYTQQLRTEVQDAVFGNVGTLISFRVGDADAALLAREYGGHYEPRTFSGLDNYEVCVRLLERGRHAEPFLGRTLPAWGRRHGRRENLIRRSREKYSTPRSIVEAKIARWMEHWDRD
jgi:hypothetical protein